ERVVARDGRYALLRSGSTEAVISGVSSWASGNRGALPYATAPFWLWVKSPVRGRARVTIATAQPANGRALLTGRSGGRVRRPSIAAHGAHLCATVPVTKGFTRVDVQPLLQGPTASPINVWQSDSDRVAGAVPVTEGPGVLIEGFSAHAG